MEAPERELEGVLEPSDPLQAAHHQALHDILPPAVVLAHIQQNQLVGGERKVLSSTFPREEGQFCPADDFCFLLCNSRALDFKYLMNKGNFLLGRRLDPNLCFLGLH